jgi:DNA-binding MarR family transcriptional regulator
MAVRSGSMTASWRPSSANSWSTSSSSSPTGRSMSVAITDQGRRTLAAAEQSWRQVHDELRESLGDDVAAVIDAWLERLEHPPTAVSR